MSTSKKVAAAKNTNTGLVILQAGETSVGAPNALNALKAELDGLKVITETQYHTDGVKLDGFSSTIQTETKIENLIRMHSSLVGRERAYNESHARLSELTGGRLQAPTFKINNFSVDTIEKDIVLRIQVLSVTERKEVLEKLVKKGEQFLTKEDQFKAYMAEVEQELGVQS